MADPGMYAFSIRKTIQWRGQTQGFSNLYHYDVVPVDETILNSILNNLKAAEKPIHDNTVTFTEGRAWGPVNSNGRGGRMEASLVWSEAGTKTAGATMYRECAYLVYWALGRYGSKNRPQFLRKWIHSQTTGLATSSDNTGNNDLGSPAAALNTYMSAVKSLAASGAGSPYALSSASGHIPTGGGNLYRYLEHHQYGH